MATNNALPVLTELGIRAAMWRGGTSRGLVLKARDILCFAPEDRDRIIRSALGSPDPDGRQIDGIGGGTSSTSKVAIWDYTSPRSGAARAKARDYGAPMPGLAWIDEDAAEMRRRSDIIYYAGQVSVQSPEIDWSSTCGNMMSAVAMMASRQRRSFLPGVPSLSPLIADIKGKSIEEVIAIMQDYATEVRIMAHDTGKVFRARLGLTPGSDLTRGAQGAGPNDYRWKSWFPLAVGVTPMAGVPTLAPRIDITSPLDEKILCTGNERDIVEIDGQRIEVTVIDTGLPVVIVDAEAINLPLEQLLAHPAEIDRNAELMDRLDRIRSAASALTPGLKSILSLTAPKICVVHRPVEYSTTGNTLIKAADMDILARTVSSGQLHRTVPATTLSALTAAKCYKNSIVAEVMARGGQEPAPTSLSVSAQQSVPEHLVSFYNLEIESPGRDREANSEVLTVGHPAGLGSATVQTRQGPNGLVPSSIVTTRTAREIWNGIILCDGNIVPRFAYDDLYPKRPPKEDATPTQSQGQQHHTQRARREGIQFYAKSYGLKPKGKDTHARET